MYMHCDELHAEMGKDLDSPLSCPTPTDKVAFRKAVRAGIISWHAGPMNMQVEFMSPGLFKQGIGLGHALDEEFGGFGWVGLCSVLGFWVVTFHFRNCDPNANNPQCTP